VGPPVLSGHALEAHNQIVLGPATLAALHKRVGQTVVAVTGHAASRVLHIVGTATLPTIGSNGPDQGLQMGDGAVAAPSVFSALQLNPQQSSVPGPMAEFVSVRTGADLGAADRSLEHVAAVLNQSPEEPAGGVVSVQRPAEIANYHSVVSIPTVLAVVVAAGAVGALGLTLMESVRVRRREMALFKAIGFTRRQLAVSVACQATLSVLVGLVVGLPVGVAVGRWLWIEFARSISAVPSPTVPVLTVVLIAVGAIVFANLVALPSARRAARVSGTPDVRSE